jgi:hypothetical protein
LAFSQPWFDLPSFSKGLSSIMVFTSWPQNGAAKGGIKFRIGNGP